MNAPSGWKLVELGTVITETQLGGNYDGAIADEGMPLMKMGNMERGRFVVEKFERLSTNAEINRRDLLNLGDVLLNTRNSMELVGKVAMWRGELREAVFNSNMMRLVPDPAQITSGAFLNYLLNSESKLREIRRRATGTTSVAAIYWRDLESVPLLLPAPPEQRKIADILGAWDEALEKLDTLIAAKDHRKKALMQQLLTGKRRLGSRTDWRRIQLSEVAEEQNVRNEETLDRSRLFAVTKAEGMVPMRERVQGATVQRCKIVEHSWFAYNPMRINIGSIARWEGKDQVMVSGDYVVFRANEDRLLSDYLNHIRQSAAWADFVRASGNGSVRVRIWFDDLGRFKFPLPSLAEQRTIADVLDAADVESRLLRSLRAALDQQKRGLMQRLLTGRLRVQVA